MDREERRLKVKEFFGITTYKELTDIAKAFFDYNIGHALYAMSELEIWPDSVDSVSVEQALLCWQIVDKLREKKFPKELWM